MISPIDTIIDSLSKEEVRFFKLFINRTVRKNRKDIDLFDYIRKQKGNYHTKDILKERLVINHLVVLFNVLGNDACSRILFLKIEEKQHYILASFLHFLHKLPKIINGINGKTMQTGDIELDKKILAALGEI